jgi:hypothetical protein
MERKIDAKVSDLFLRKVYEDKKKELEDLRSKDQKDNPKNYSRRSWTIIFQTLEYVFNDTPIHIYNRNKTKPKTKNKTKKPDSKKGKTE